MLSFSSIVHFFVVASYSNFDLMLERVDQGKSSVVLCGVMVLQSAMPWSPCLGRGAERRSARGLDPSTKACLF